MDNLEQITYHGIKYLKKNDDIYNLEEYNKNGAFKKLGKYDDEEIIFPNEELQMWNPDFDDDAEFEPQRDIIQYVKHKK